MVKVVYRDGSSEIFLTDTYCHSSVHKMFFVEIAAGCRLMIPDDVVRTIGKGRIEEIVTVENGREKSRKEVFVYE